MAGQRHSIAELATGGIVLLATAGFLAYAVARLIDRRREKARPDWLETSDDEASAL